MRRIVGVALWLAVLACVGLDALPPSFGSTTPLGLDLYRPTPADNPLTVEKIELGRRLFHDRRLSRDGTLSCAGCHDPSHAFTDGRVVARGAAASVGRRNVPTLINRVYGASFFWDGRAASLEQQVVQPLLDAREMATTPEAVVVVVQDDRRYRERFLTAFGREPQWDDVARALASYVRSVRSGNSRYDRFQHGEKSALTLQEQRGMRLFLGRANCWHCHVGPNLTDERFHNTGVAFRDGQLLDAGRFDVTARPADRGAFKTPTLREVARTGPYMHDGSLPTLDAVVDYYNRGANPNPGLDSDVHPLRLTVDERRALVDFLRVLSGKVQDGS